MAIPLYGSVGALFNRLGKCGLLVKQHKSYFTAQQANLVDTTNGLVAQLNAESDIQAIVGDGYISSLSSADGSVSIAQQVADAVINRMVFRDNPQFGQTLTTGNTLTSISEVIRQMKIAGATVLAQTVTATPLAGGQQGGNFIGTGNGLIIASNIRPFDGRVVENAYAENLTFVCSADSYTGGTNPFNESFQITGAGSQGNIFAFNWPLGSNANATQQAVDGDTSNGAGNFLNNSGWAAFTANSPNQWTILAGIPGTNIFQETGLIFSGGSAMRWQGDGTTKFALQQQFGSSLGTSSTLTPQQQYSHAIWLRRGGAPVTLGSLEVSLIDNNGAYVKDQAGVNQLYNIDLTTLSTTYTGFSGVFRTPEVWPPSSYFIRYRCTVAPNAGALIYLDKGALGGMGQPYGQGPFVSVHAGGTPALLNDYGYVAITNGRGAGGTLSTWQTLLGQLLPVGFNNGVLWPSSATPTISDGLIA